MSRTAKPNYELNAPLLRSRLKLKHIQSENILKNHHPVAYAMLEAAGVRPGSIRAHAAKLLAAGATATTLILAPYPSSSGSSLLPSGSLHASSVPKDQESELKNRLRELLPVEIRPLLTGEENQITGLLHELYGLHAVPELEGNRLNTDYGYIGAEQHLTRYPGDNVWSHGFRPESGMAPGLGAWGYFATSVRLLTPDLILREKYYVAVQTLYLPEWQARLEYLRDWYQFRKVAVINPQNGKIMIADIADSGPALWTGKQFGGSPEVMDYLQSHDGRQRGPVILFFVDDPENRVPLGPLEYNLEQVPLLSAKNV